MWVTETGWPVRGPTTGKAVETRANAETYWQDVYCSLVGKKNVWWYILDDSLPTEPVTSFGVVGNLTAAPKYDLSC